MINVAPPTEIVYNVSKENAFSTWVEIQALLRHFKWFLQDVTIDDEVKRLVIGELAREWGYVVYRSDGLPFGHGVIMLSEEKY